MIHIAHLTKLYGSVIGVNDVTVDLGVGAHGLLGPNGAGKTTFLGLITGQLRPTMGQVEVFGEPPFANPRVLRRIGYCPAADLGERHASSQVWVRYLVRLSGFTGNDANRRTERAIEQVGLNAASRRPIATLSKGMRQRVKLAAAIAHDPDLLVLDEPFIGLDPVARHELVHLVRGWSRDRSLIVASHLLHEVEALDAGLAVILGGRLVASGTAAEIRGLIESLPAEIRVRCSPPHRFAEVAWRSVGVEAVRVEANDTVVVATRQPAALAAIVQQAASDGMPITEVMPADRSLEGIFGRLVQLHRGVGP
ncbi:MAG: ABC transporter ATP-binding protein [Planctomycetota bacterium]|jgi:ABC-2 type transport system ATP-binding protein|nr:ABC transporter ATP-binding protein [Planctomycetota bacterium]